MPQQEGLLVEEFGDKPNVFRIEVTRMPPSRREWIGVGRRLYQVNGVSDDPMITRDGNMILVTINLITRLDRLNAVLTIIQILQELGLHTGVLRGPLAETLQGPLNSGLPVRQS